MRWEKSNAPFGYEGCICMAFFLGGIHGSIWIICINRKNERKSACCNVTVRGAEQ